jgi:hypothetical protein
MDLRRQHVLVELDRARDVAHQEVHRESGQPPPVPVARHPGIAGARLHRAGPPRRENIDPAGNDCPIRFTLTVSS